MNSSKKFSPVEAQSFFKAKSLRANSFLTTQIQRNFQLKQNNPYYETLRLSIKKFLAKTILGRLYINILQLLSFIFMLQYVIQTYLRNNSKVYFLFFFFLILLFLILLLLILTLLLLLLLGYA